MAPGMLDDDFDMSEFRDGFFEEAAEHLVAMERGLLTLDEQGADATDPEVLNAIFRAAHSIKGVAASLGFDEIAEFTHVLEELLDGMRRGLIAATPVRVQLLLRATDTVNALVEASRADNAASVDTRDVVVALHHELGTDPAAGDAASDERASEPAASVTASPVTASPVAAAPVAAAPAAAAPAGAPIAVPAAPRVRTVEIRFVPNPEIFLTGQDPLLVMRELTELGEVVHLDTDASRVPTLEALNPETCHVSWTIRLQTAASRERIEEALLFVEDVSDIDIREVEGDEAPTDELALAPRPHASAVTTGTALTVIEPVVVATSGTDGDRREAGDRRESTDRRESPDRRGTTSPDTASIRVPIDKIDALVDLVGELVIAQAMVNQIADGFTAARLTALQDALATLDRNTRDLQERVMAVRMLPVGTVFSRFPRLVRDLSGKLGKKIRLDLVGSETELDKGMIERLGDPLTHLVRNAIDHGLETPDERRAAGKPDEGVLTLRASHEGGSVVIEVAEDGRGLNTARIREKAISNGLISADEVLSVEDTHALIFAPGFSTAATVSDVSGRGVGMDVVKKNVEAMNGSVTIHSEPGVGSRFRIRLPLTLAILDGLIVRVGGESYVLPLLSVVESMRPSPRDVRDILGRGEVLIVRGASIPFIRLHALFGHPEAITEPSHGIIVVIESEERRFGVLVDELLGQQQVVIKNLENNFRKLDAIIGATILGDGRISLIADVQELCRQATHDSMFEPAY